MAATTYTRLTRTRLTRWFAVANAPRVSLWLGNDHLLQVEHDGFGETYKRFYFRDIQAFTMAESPRRAIWNAVLAIPLAGCLIGIIVSAATGPNWVIMPVWFIFTFVFGLPFLINNFRGAACTCEIRTAVQTEPLRSLSRVRQTQKVLARLRPLIAAAQGQLTGEEVSVRMREAAGQSIPPQPATPQSAPPVVS
jgi:hypothetical protein